MVTLRIPAPPKELWSNLLGVAGLVTICVALGFLTDWRWALGLAGVFCVVLAVLSATAAAPAEAAAAVPQLAAKRKPAA